MLKLPYKNSCFKFDAFSRKNGLFFPQKRALKSKSVNSIMLFWLTWVDGESPYNCVESEDILVIRSCCCGSLSFKKESICWWSFSASSGLFTWDDWPAMLTSSWLLSFDHCSDCNLMWLKFLVVLKRFIYTLLNSSLINYVFYL